MKFRLYILSALLGIAISCGGDGEAGIENINIISATLNGSSVPGNFSSVSLNSTVAITFDAAVSPNDFENAVSISSSTGSESFQVSYQNNSSRAIVSLELDYNTTYTFSIGALSIGSAGQSLSSPFSFQFTTMEDDVIRSMDPCSSASADCTETANFSIESGSADFEFFSNYPIYSENAEWENLTAAIILVHGVNRNSDDYFNWMTSTLEELSLDGNTVLVAPSFKVEPEASAEEFFWNSSEWREGADSKNSASISSFAVVDSLIAQLSNADRFPVMEKIIVTGHSSGGLFTHAYGAANQIESNVSVDLTYIVANSQYFYYPSGERINESNDQLYTPAGCATYDFWPLGYNNVPGYVAQVPEADLKDQFVSRDIYYLLGNGNDADPSLNTTDCDATLLGSTRFSRGENMFQYMELSFTGEHNHMKYLVEGIGHDGQRMYQSDEFKTLLENILN